MRSQRAMTHLASPLLRALVVAGAVVIGGCAVDPTKQVGGTGGAPATDGTGGTPSTDGTGGTSGGTGGAAVTCNHPDMVNGHNVAPCGYYVDGNKVYRYDGQVKVFRGLARPSMEWTPLGEMVNDADFDNMAKWKPNVVRFSLNQDFYLPGTAKSSGAYPQYIAQWVRKAKERGMDVILDLHWSDTGNLQNATPGQQKMADRNSITFWTMVATQFKGDGRVMFELYNEPHDISWQVWKSGGNVDGWQAAGMQQLYDAVRAAGAHNLVLIGGLDYAFDLSQVTSNRINGYNIAYVTHPYGQFANKRDPNQWNTAFGNLATTDPIFITEFGDTTDCNAGGRFNQSVIDYAAARGISWTAWAWYVKDCQFPSIIADWAGNPSAAGQPVKSAMASN